jgi:hypothetical protein
MVGISQEQPEAAREKIQAGSRGWGQRQGVVSVPTFMLASQ